MTTSVLLVEDNIPDARYVKEILPKRTYEVSHATTLAQAHDKVSDHKFDVVLLDLSLPDGSGLESFLSMVGWSPTIPIIILTGLDDEDVALRAVQLGAQDYILKKEINEHNLLRSIRYTIERKQFEEKAKRVLVLEQREEFMATLTHDLKNPLIGANLILELMAQQVMGNLSDEQAKLLLQMRDNNKMLLSMIQNLIEVYRFEKDINAVNLENTNLLAIITACIEDIAPIAHNREISLKTDFPDSLREVRADRNAIRRVV